MHGIVAVAQVQRHVLLGLLDVDARWTTQVDRRRQIQVDAAQTIGSLAEALRLGRRRRSPHGIRQIPREQGLCRGKIKGAMRETREEKLERNESRRSKVNGKNRRCFPAAGHVHVHEFSRDRLTSFRLYSTSRNVGPSKTMLPRSTKRVRSVSTEQARVYPPTFSPHRDKLRLMRPKSIFIHQL